MRGRRSYNRSISCKKPRQPPRIKGATKGRATIPVGSFATGAVGPKPATLSPEAQEILKNGVGYRTESAYGEGYRDAKAVIEHEIKELGNTTEKPNAARALGLPANANLKQIWDEIDRRFGKDAKVLWLATKEGVKYYLDNEGEGDDGDWSVDKFTIPPGALLLTDLGYDGQLFLMNAKDYSEVEKSATSVPVK